MSTRDRHGILRQAVVTGGALFLALTGVYFVANLSAEPVAYERGATLIDPAGVRADDLVGPLRYGR